jgi:hypothetical protein
MGLALGVALMLPASDQKTEAQQRGPAGARAGANAPSSIPMGGNKSVTRFFRLQQRGSAKATVSPAPMRTARRWRERKTDLKPKSNRHHQVRLIRSGAGHSPTLQCGGFQRSVPFCKAVSTIRS